MAIGEPYVNHLIALIQIDGNDAIGARAGVLLQDGLLHDAKLGGEDDVVAIDELLIVEATTAQAEESVDGVVALDVEKILNGTPLGVLLSLGNVVAVKPVDASLLGEEKHGLVHRGGIDVFREVVVAGMGALGTHTASGLLAEFAQRSALDVAQVADGDDHGVVGVEVFGVELMLVGDDLGASLIVELLLHFQKLFLHHFFARLGIVKNGLQFLDVPHQLVKLGMQLLQTKTRELREAHVDNGLALEVVEVEALLQVGLSLSRGLAATDDMHHLVYVVAGDDQAFKDVRALLGLSEVILCAADGYVVAMLYKVPHAVGKAQQAGSSLDQSNAVDREGTLKGCKLEELVENDIGVGILLHVHNDAHSLTARLVVDIGDAVNLTLFHQVGDILNELPLVDTVGNLSHHNLVVALASLDLGLGTHDDATAPGLVSFLDSLQAIDVSSSGEVGCWNMSHQLGTGDSGIVYEGATAVYHLAQIVGGDVGGHTYGNAISAIDQEVGNLGGHDGWFLQGVIEVVDHVDGLFLKVVHRALSHLGEAALGVTHGSWRVAIDRPEVALPVDELVAHVPILPHAHQSPVYGTVAMGMVFAQDLANDTRAFLVRFVARVANARHSVENTAVDGLEAITHVGQRPCHDDRHGIVDVRGLHLLFNVDL